MKWSENGEAKNKGGSIYIYYEVSLLNLEDAAKEASEGAVSGFFTGLVKLPFTLVGSLASPIAKDLDADVAEKLTEKDFELMANAGNQAI